MASERDAAKESVSGEQDSDPELSVQFEESASFRLEHVREENRHKELLHRQKLGWFGKFLGDAQSGPTVVAFVALLLFSTVGVGCLGAAFFLGQVHPTVGTDVSQFAELATHARTTASFWSDNAKNAFAIALSALGYIFGRGSKSE